MTAGPQRHPLALTAGQSRHRPIKQGMKVQKLEDFGPVRPGRSGRCPRRTIGQIAGDALMREKPGVLEGDADAAAVYRHAAGPVMPGFASETNLAGQAGIPPGNGPQKRGLAGTGWPADRNNAAGREAGPAAQDEAPDPAREVEFQAAIRHGAGSGDSASKPG